MATRPDPVGLRIAKRRQVLGLRQEDLAQRLGVAVSTVANWETGKHFPRRYLGRVEEALGISLTAEEEEEQPLSPELVQYVGTLSRERLEQLRHLISGVLRQLEEGDNPQRANGG